MVLEKILDVAVEKLEDIDGEDVKSNERKEFDKIAEKKFEGWEKEITKMEKSRQKSNEDKVVKEMEEFYQKSDEKNSNSIEALKFLKDEISLNLINNI